MKKIMIIGSGGAGKSTLAKALHDQLHLPLIHLDREFWRAGWVEPDKAWWTQRMHELVAEDHWILDGNYGGTMDIRLEVADTIIFLAYSRWVCTYGILRRWWFNRGQHRPDMPEGCQEKMDWQFVRYVFRYNDTRKPGILKKLAKLEGEKQVLVFRRRREAKRWLKSIA